MGEIERFLPEGGGERPLREGGLHPGTGSADSSSRTTSTSGWTPVGPRSASSTTPAKGCLETRRKGLDSGRGAGVAVPVRRPHGTTRRSPNTFPRRSRVAKRGGRAAEAGGAGRIEAAAHTRPRDAEGAAWRCRAVPTGGWGREAASGRRSPAGGFRRQFVACDFDFRLDAGGAGEGRGPHLLDGALCSASKGRILYDSREGVPGNPAQRDSTSVERQVKRCLSGGPTGLPGAVPIHMLGGADLRSAAAVRKAPAESARPLHDRRRRGRPGAVRPASGGRAGSPLRDGVPR